MRLSRRSSMLCRCREEIHMTINELLESVRRVEVRTNRLVNDMMVGAYLSHFRGRGMDFEELREYTPGDDVRDIDWNVTNRMGRPFVKRFREERELAEVELFVPPRKGRRHILRLIREMLFFKPKHRGTNIPGALTFLNHVLHRRSIVFLLTDFLHSFGNRQDSASPLTPSLSPSDGERVAEGRVRGGRDAIQEIGLTNARHDLVCVHLHDRRESTLPPAGLLTIEDAETDELLELDSGR